MCPDLGRTYWSPDLDGKALIFLIYSSYFSLFIFFNTSSLIFQFFAYISDFSWRNVVAALKGFVGIGHSCLFSSIYVNNQWPWINNLRTQGCFTFWRISTLSLSILFFVCIGLRTPIERFAADKRTSADLCSTAYSTVTNYAVDYFAWYRENAWQSSRNKSKIILNYCTASLVGPQAAQCGCKKMHQKKRKKLSFWFWEMYYIYFVLRYVNRQ